MTGRYRSRAASIVGHIGIGKANSIKSILWGAVSGMSEFTAALLHCFARGVTDPRPVAGVRFRLS